MQIIMYKSKKSTNKFNRSYEGLRKFLRLVSYGCYHRKLFKSKEINPRTYDEFLRQIRFFISEKNIQLTYHDRFAYFTFAGDFYHETTNYLYSSFLTKSLLASHCLQYITILQIMGQTKKPLSLPVLADKVSEIIVTHDETLENNDFLQLTRRRLNELVEAGFLRKVNHSGSLFYELIPNPLKNLSKSEAAALKMALDFYKNYSLISLPGYFLYDSLMNLYDDEPAKIFQFKNNNFTRILDDDILFSIVQALKQKRKLELERENKPPLKITPFSIETDFLLNRQYLLALRNNRNRLEPVRLRIDKILKVKLLPEEVDSAISTSERLREIYLRVHFNDEEERIHRISILNGQFDIEIVNTENNAFTCRISVTDPLRYYPLLWTVQSWRRFYLAIMVFVSE